MAETMGVCPNCKGQPNTPNCRLAREMAKDLAESIKELEEG